MPAGVVAHVPVRRGPPASHADRRVALHVDALDAAAVDEVVDVARRPRRSTACCRYPSPTTPSAPALRQSMSRLNCGVSSCPLGRTERDGVGFCAAMPSSWFARRQQLLVARAAACLEVEVEARGVAEFDDRGRREREDHGVADLREGADGAAGDAPVALIAAPGRSSQSFSLTKAMPVFWPLPPKLKPATAKTDCDRGVPRSRKWFSTCSTTASVRSCVAPAAAAGSARTGCPGPRPAGSPWAVRRNRNTTATSDQAVDQRRSASGRLTIQPTAPA